MTPPDFPALAREWISYCLARAEPWTEDEEAAALAKRFRSVHAAGMEAGVREAAAVCQRESDAWRGHPDPTRSIAARADTAKACAALILALLPEPKP